MDRKLPGQNIFWSGLIVFMERGYLSNVAIVYILRQAEEGYFQHKALVLFAQVFFQRMNSPI